MLRIIYSITINLVRAYLVPIIHLMAAHPNRFSTETRYRYIRHVAKVVAKTSRVRTRVYGTENLPKEGGYMMYPNHQGKYDALAVVIGHKQPCTLVMDYKRSNLYLVNQIMYVIDGKRLKRDDVRQAMSVILKTAKDAKDGQRIILFPEGGYDRKKCNSLYEFKPGAFKTSVISKTPIVPVVLYDTYKVYSNNSIRKIYNEVHYLSPIPYTEYQGMKTVEIAAMVKQRIREKLEQLQLEKSMGVSLH